MSWLFTRQETACLQSQLEQAGMGIPARSYLFRSLLLSLFLASVLFGAFYFLLRDAPTSLSLSLLSFSLIFLVLKSLPAFQAKRRAAQLEAELPFLLRFLAAELSLNTPFEKAIERAARMRYQTSAELALVLNEVKKGGATFPDALRRLAGRVGSLAFRRAVAHLVAAYQHGGQGEALKRLADELIDVQKAGAREYAAALSFLGLLFLAVACVIPALFQAYVVVGSAIFSPIFTASDIWLAYLVVFPLLGLLVIMAIRMKAPPFLHSSLSSPLSEEEMARLDAVVPAPFAHFGAKRLILLSLAVGILCFLLLLALSLSAPAMRAYSPIPLALPALTYLSLSYRLEQRTKELERFLPDALFQASSFPRGVSVERILESIAGSGFGPLSEEFRMALNQVRSGMPLERAVLEIGERNDSLLLSRATHLLAAGWSAGAAFEHAVRETAEDIMGFAALVRERAALLAMQKYTMLIGGSVLVPFILALVANMVAELNLSAGALFSALPATERLTLFSATLDAVQAYLIIYAFLSGLLVAFQEGSPRKALVYFLILAPLSLGVFKLSLGLHLLA
ncbi:MAG: type II secretion system F family protein [Candidatus Micrarchaeia archaeon]